MNEKDQIILKDVLHKFEYAFKFHGFNVLDIVLLANCILAGNCDTLEFGCAGNMNGDSDVDDLDDDGNTDEPAWNVMDIVQLANCILSNTCS